MDPSYNNNFGSSDNGANMASVSSGDVVLSAPAPQKKSKKGLILIIAVIILVLVGVGYFVFLQVNKEQVQTSGVKTVYNSYANYVMFGKDSEADIDEESIIEALPYFYNLADTQRASYMMKAENKYTSFKEKYSGKYDIAVLKSFFQDYAKINLVDLAEVVELYGEEGGSEQAVINLLDERYATDENTEKYWKDYLTAERALSEALLTQVKNASAAGCVKDGVMIDGCYTATETESAIIGEKTIETMSAANSLENMAVNTLIDIYDEIYNFDEAEEE